MTSTVAQLLKGVEIFDEFFILKVSKDCMSAILLPKGEIAVEEIKMDRLAEELRGHGIVYGLLEKPEVDAQGRFLIARGKEVQQGEDARVRMHVKPAEGSMPRRRDPDKDQVDYREQGAIVNVSKGALLLEKIPPTNGTPGIDIFGKEVRPKPGKDRSMKIGPGVEMSEDGLRIVSKLDGKFLMQDGRPAVQEEHTVSGDVDMTIGNIAFAGISLIITGEVLPGFSVKCKGTVVVQKGIQNAMIMAEGDINVHGGVVGEEAVLRSKGSIKLDFAENGPHFEAKGNLVIENFMVQCYAKLNGDIMALTGEGTVIGGEFVVGGSMYVKELGSDAEVGTSVSVGINPSLLSQKQKASEELKLWSGRMSEILKNMTSLEKIKKEEGANFPADKEELLRKYKTAMPKASDKVNSLTELEKTVGQALEEMVDEKIFVLGKVYPGVSVKIGNAVRFVSMEEEKVVICYERDSRQIIIRKMKDEEAAYFG